MVKRILILIIILFMPSVLGYNFSEYPDFLFKEYILVPLSYPPNATVWRVDIDVTIVIGGDPTAEDGVGAGDIHMSLEYFDPIKRYLPHSISMGPTNTLGGTKFPSEVSYVDTNNIIIGGPCANPFAARLLNKPSNWPECADGFEPGKGKIAIYEKWGKIKILVAGYHPEDTRMAANFLAKAISNDFNGTEIETYTNELGDEKGNIRFEVVK